MYSLVGCPSKDGERSCSVWLLVCARSRCVGITSVEFVHDLRSRLLASWEEVLAVDDVVGSPAYDGQGTNMVVLVADTHCGCVWIALVEVLHHLSRRCLASWED